MKTSEQLSNIAAALSAFHGECENPERNKTVTVTTSRGSYTFKFATFDTIIDMARPILAKNGLSVIQSIGSGELSGNTLMFNITTRILHTSGEWIEDTLTAVVPPEAKKAGDSGIQVPPGPQPVGSCISYFKRYAYCAILNISAEEDDDGNRAEGNHVETRRESPPKPKEDPEAARLRALAKDKASALFRGDADGGRENVAKLLKAVGAEGKRLNTPGDLTIDQLDKVVIMLSEIEDSRGGNT